MGEEEEAAQGKARGGTREGYSSPLKHASPLSEGEAIFSEIFGIYSTLKTIF